MVCDTQCNGLFAARRGLCWHNLYRWECSYVYNIHAQCQHDGWCKQLDELSLSKDDMVTARD